VSAALRFAVVGDPVAHSKSPAMHRAAYAALGLPHVYDAVRVTAEELPGFVERLRAGEYAGLNVTVPHKVRALELADDADPGARAVRAANTLVAREGAVVAHNTDVPALAAEIARLGAGSGGDALVLGSGGAARAAAAAARAAGFARVVVRSRRPLAEARLGGVDVEVEALGARATDGRFACILQATSAGMAGADPGDAVAAAVDWSRVDASAVALDLVYAPPETPFLRAARARGLRCDNGLGMLVEQGALAFELWLRVAPPRDVMRAAIAPP